MTARPRRPRVLLSVATSVDGYIDTAGPERLLLSGEEDFDRVDAERAGCDAILVGAGTLRRDDPRLLVRSAERRAARLAAGLPEHPAKVVLTTSGDLDPAARFFTTGPAECLVYCPGRAVPGAAARLEDAATVVDAGDPLDPVRVLADLAGRGVRRLMVEGGGGMHTLFLTAGLVDEIQLVVAPFFVGDPDAPRFVGPGTFPHGPGNRMTPVETRLVGDCVLIRWLTRPPAHTGDHV
ncbi:dihydrofolate reductase family protein [Streptomyces sp. ST2-7A]|uniref:RibD family protein n=1 Tax=Streptomyces sp. ST2-7A TaxID=2907214 RepID=UPI0027E2BAF4|nr:dihydrofolate reductase family protein [Streptomyces sp. ST2-7A]